MVIALRILLLTLFASFTLASDCSNPLLRNNGNPTGPEGLSEPTNITAKLLYCKRLALQNSCCDAKTINNFAQNITDRINQLSDQLIPKDIDLYKLQSAFTTFQNAYNNFSTYYNLFSTNLNFLNVALQIRLGEYLKNITALWNRVSMFQTSLDEYQYNRQQCLITLHNITASLFCLACDPTYEDEGIVKNGTSSTIYLNTDDCAAIKRNCEPYIDQSWKASGLLLISSAVYYVQNVTLALRNASISLKASDFYLTQPYPNMTINTTMPNLDLIAVNKPSTCITKESCDWACHNLLTGFGEVLNITAVLGGIPIYENETFSTSSITNTSYTSTITFSEDGYNTQNPYYASGVPIIVNPNPSEGYTGSTRIVAAGTLILLLFFCLLGL